jgi:hypothetical protein
MSKLTQGTQLFFIDPDDNSVVVVPGLSTLSPGGSPADQIEDTDLSSSVRTYKRGLRTPSQGSATVFADPEEAAHVRLFELSVGVANTNLQWAIGWSDGTATPTADSAGFVIPVDSSDAYTRSFVTFAGYVSDFPFDFAINTVVTSAFSVQRSGDNAWFRKGETAA